MVFVIRKNVCVIITEIGQILVPKKFKLQFYSELEYFVVYT